jgi:hypothetical protein
MANGFYLNETACREFCEEPQGLRHVGNSQGATGRISARGAASFSQHCGRFLPFAELDGASWGTKESQKRAHHFSADSARGLAFMQRAVEAAIHCSGGANPGQ